MEAAAIRRGRMTLLDQISIMDPANLRNLLEVCREDAAAGGDRIGNATLASMLESEKRGGRTLLDVIRNDRVSPGEPSDSPGGVIGGEAEPEREVLRPMRVSLMTLLSLADPAQAEESRSGEAVAVAVASEVEPSAADERMVCCVCMVRRKGAAFIPCGHTFCRACSRDLMTGRGSCPLCNSSIIDILDIF